MPRNPNSPRNPGCGPVHTHTSASENIKLQMMMAKLEDSLKDEFVLKEQLKTINSESLVDKDAGNIDITYIKDIKKTATEGLVDTYTIYFNNAEPYSFTVTNGEKGDKGETGDKGDTGASGREIELNKSDTHIQWRYVGETTWKDLITLESLKGADGIDGQNIELTKDSEFIQWKYTEDSTWKPLIAVADLKGSDGKDGREVVITIQDDKLVWCYKDEENDLTKYRDIIALTALKGDKGDNGQNGAPGKDGADGQSAYALWVALGNSGTEQDFINSLKGKDGQNGTNGQNGSNGTDGKDGVGIAKTEITVDGKLVITYTDGTSTNLGKVVGSDGKDGANGTNGQNGTNGLDGKDGLGIAKSEINENGELILTYTNNTNVNLGKVVGTNGKDGIDGVNGTPGLDGINGKSAYETWLSLGNMGSEEDFIKSLNGQDGKDGTDGKPFTFEDLTPAQKLELKGEQGDPGLTTAIKIGETTYEQTNGIIELPEIDLASKADNIPFIADKFVTKAFGEFKLGDSVKGLSVAEILAKLLGLTDVNPENPETPDNPDEPTGIIKTIIQTQMPMYAVEANGELVEIPFKLLSMTEAEAAQAPTQEGFFQITLDSGEVVSGYQELQADSNEIYYVIALPKIVDYDTMVTMSVYDDNLLVWTDAEKFKLTKDTTEVAALCDEAGIDISHIDTNMYTIWALEDCPTGSKIRFIIHE
jgi:hypothetical protein